ncbi:MAG TPA: glycosyltransferase family 1 protein [Solirubrobacterales bacterium]
MSGLRVAIDARLGTGISGGVEQIVIGLATALGRLDGGDEEYLFVVHPDQEDWIRPYLSGPCRSLASRIEYPGQPGLLRELGRGVRRRLPLGDPYRRAVLRSDGTIERAGVEAVHFPFQEAFLTEVPSVYQPHDLQHLHLPEHFSGFERGRREVVYRAHCERAALVVAMTSWGRGDLIEQYGLAPEKVAVVPGGSVLGEYPAPSAADLDRLRSRLDLPESFLLYPAQTWPHKNHLRLLDAVALLRDRDGIEIRLVCPGRRTELYPRIAERIGRLRLEEWVSFPGFVGPLELRGLYELATGLAFPSSFEGWGLPVCEAFSAGLPVAASSATGLPDVVGDAGLLFDPGDPAAIADAIRALWTDPALRARLAERGLERAGLFSFDRAAAIFRAHYRSIAGRKLPEEDRILLAGPPPV